MIVKQSKKSLFFLAFALQVSGAMSAAAPAAQEPGFFRALGSDALSLAKGIGYCIGGVAKGFASTYLLARKYPGQAVAVAVGVPLLMRWAYVKGYEKNIKPIKDKYREPGRFSAWASDFWEDHSHIIHDQNQVIYKFTTEMGAPSQATIDLLIAEIAAIKRDMKILEDGYLVRGFPLGFSLYNIKREYADIKGSVAPGKGQVFLNARQLQLIESGMKNKRNSKWLPYILFSLNYGQAAQTWWDLKKKELKLKALMDLIQDHMQKGSPNLAANRTRTVVDNRANIVITNGDE